MANGDVCGGIFSDWASHEYTAFKDRPAGKKLWAVLKAGDIIVIPYVHTMFRYASDYRNLISELNELGVTVLIEGVSPMAREGMRVLADADHRGRSRVIRRGKAKREHRKENGDAETKTKS
jgi:DNA invertase Pin-like site-specific DNA recombinase